jgi:hypothetical protein
MSAVADAMVWLEAKLKVIPEFAGAVARDPSAPLAALPAIVMGPPEMLWATACPGPNDIRLILYVVVDADDRALERLWDLAPIAANFVEANTDAVVVNPVSPGSYISGTTELPAYKITIELPV